MSIYFRDGERRDLWNPSSGTARVFHEQARTIARLIGIDSGLGPIEEDVVLVDRTGFTEFVEAFAEWMRHTGSAAAHAMLDGCFAIAAGLAEKLGAPTSRYGLDELVTRVE